MKLTITINIEAPDSIPGYSSVEHAVKYTLCDALAEFQRARMPVSTYINQRYGDNAPEGKLDEVAARIALAETMRNAAAGGLTFDDHYVCDRCGFVK